MGSEAQATGPLGTLHGTDHPGPSSDDEARLIEKARLGDVQAFSALVLVHHARVRGYIGGYLSSSDAGDDLAQEVFFAAFRHLDGYRAEAPFIVWLLRSARNRMISYLRTEARRRVREHDSIDETLFTWTLDQLENDEADPTRHEREMARLQACLAKLPPVSARMIREHYLQARTIVEIARDLGKKEGTVRMTLLRLRQALRQCLQQQGPAAAGLEGG